jgi:glycosyltransferase involved in cell wall biosynthesis
MKICMLLYDMQDFGGLEEYVVSLAFGLQQQGHQVSVVSSAWVAESNQYLRRLRDINVPLIQLPKWIFLVLSDWDTKEQILRRAVLLLSPLVYLLGVGVLLFKRRPWSDAVASSRNWLRGRLMNRIIGPDRRRPLTRMILNLWRLRWRPDLLHIHSYIHGSETDLLFSLDWAYGKKLPVVYEEHQTPDPNLDWWQKFRKSINKASIVVAVSNESAQALQRVCGVTRPIMVSGPIVPDPINSGWRQNSRARADIDCLSMVTFARLDGAKGLPYLLKAISKVKAIHPSVDFKVYGKGALLSELIEYANQLDMEGEKIFVGAFAGRKQLSHILTHADIFVMSSIREGQPVALVEAMAYGCAVVCTSVGGIPELIQDGINGLLCEPGDPESLVQKMLALIEDPALRFRLGREARKSYENGPFQPISACRNFVSIYQRALQVIRPIYTD